MAPGESILIVDDDPLLRLIAFPVDHRTPPPLCGLLRRLG